MIFVQIGLAAYTAAAVYSIPKYEQVLRSKRMSVWDKLSSLPFTSSLCGAYTLAAGVGHFAIAFFSSQPKSDLVEGVRGVTYGLAYQVIPSGLFAKVALKKED